MFANGFKPFIFVETSYLNIDTSKFESLQKKKAEPSRLIPRKLGTKLDLLTGHSLCLKLQFARFL